MQNLETRMVPSRGAAPPPLSTLKPFTPTLAPSRTKLLLVDFRSGEAVSKHPEVAPYLRQGWCIRSAVPRIVESKGTRLLVVLGRESRAPALTRIK